MPESLVLSLIGPDRPGIVEALSRIIEEHGANWTESRMARLANQFAGILLVSVAEEQSAALTRALQELDLEGLQVAVNASAVPARRPGTRQVKLELTGQDRPGIVHQIARLLAEQGVSIEDLETHCKSASWSGELLFHAKANLLAPADLDTDTLLRLVERIANELMVEIELHEARGT